MSGSSAELAVEPANDGWSAFEVWRQTIHEPRRRRIVEDLSRNAAQVEDKRHQWDIEFQNAHL